MKRPTISCIAAFFIVYVVLPFAGYICLVKKQGTDIELALVKNEGIKIVKAIKEHDFLDNYSTTKINFTNSTEFFSMLMKKDENIMRLFAHSSKAVKEDSPELAGLKSKNNIWTVIQNLPTNAPGHVVVLASRNINPSSLRTRLNKYDMDKEISFDLKGESGLLRYYALLIRKDGNGLILRCRRGLFSSSLRHRRYGYIYSGKSFDLTTNGIGSLRAIYLTPHGEVTPENR